MLIWQREKTKRCGCLIQDLRFGCGCGRGRCSFDLSFRKRTCKGCDLVRHLGGLTLGKHLLCLGIQGLHRIYILQKL